MDYIFFYLASIIAVLCVFVPHEYAHAFVAYKNGDGTAKMYGRMTLNPLKHIDPVGIVLCMFTGFGWAKPVPINPLYLLMAKAVVSSAVLSYILGFFSTLFYLIFLYSLSVFVFNLLPLYPLDGFRVIESFTREVNPVRRFLRNYGSYILIILVVESFLCGLLMDYTNLPYVQYFDILGYVQWFARNIVGYPITALWNLIIL